MVSLLKNRTTRLFIGLSALLVMQSSHAIEPLSDAELEKARIGNGVVLETDASEDGSETSTSQKPLSTVDDSVDYELYRTQNQSVSVSRIDNVNIQTSGAFSANQSLQQQQVGIEFLNTTPLQNQLILDNTDLVNQGLEPFNIKYC